jgi:hypothetical protein
MLIQQVQNLSIASANRQKSGLAPVTKTAKASSVSTLGSIASAFGF